MRDASSPPHSATLWSLCLLLAATAGMGPAALAQDADPGPGAAELPPAPPPVKVDVDDNYFRPREVVIEAGQEVAWVNRGMWRHTVTSAAGLFDSGILGQLPFKVTFDEPGTYAYVCIYHPSTMVATVEVVPPRPDLVVASVQAEETTPGVEQSITVTLANLGRGVAAPAPLSLAYVYQGEEWPIRETMAPEVPPGGTATAHATWGTLGKLGTFDLVATADPHNVVDEGREDNNLGHGEATVLPLVDGVDFDGFDALDPL